jgi:hypothetical protein
VVLDLAAILGPAICQDAQQGDAAICKEWKNPAVEQVRRRDRRLPGEELADRDTGVGIDKDLRPLCDASIACRTTGEIRPTPFIVPTLQVSWLPRKPGWWLSISPCASQWLFAFSSAATCSSVSWMPSWAARASSASTGASRPVADRRIASSSRSRLPG